MIRDQYYQFLILDFQAITVQDKIKSLPIKINIQNYETYFPIPVACTHFFRAECC